MALRSRHQAVAGGLTIEGTSRHHGACMLARLSSPPRRCLFFGGIQGSGTRSSEFFDDTYLYNSISGQWRQLDVQGPGKRSGSIAFYSSSQDAVYLWGGKNVDTLPNSLWRFDVVNEQWTEVATSGDKPLGREDPIHFWNDAEGHSVYGKWRRYQEWDQSV